ncbi:unnamed protein product [Linum tenue]|uniref:EF-hand domain-containing protein n=4 Tax=Linum tenue TaxID=586396 RepID=A0AAV0P355_9ROSI|nr:unnamed protein product [Linum tenue]
MATAAAVSSPTKRSSSGKGFKLSLPLLRSIHTNNKPNKPSPNPSPSASPAPPRKEADLLRVFRHFDRDGDGRISAVELGMYFASTTGEAMSREDAERVIGEFDGDGDGTLGFGDFVRMVDGGGGDGREFDGDLRRAFEMFEEDKGEGCITPRGLQRMLVRLGDRKSLDECTAMIRPFDLDGDGVLDFPEFQRMMN